jgi:DNA-binding NarL/FixJ family response regulator
MKQARVLLADDHALFREGLGWDHQRNQPDMQVVGDKPTMAWKPSSKRRN